MNSRALNSSRFFRGMTDQRRLRLAEQLYWSARKMKRVGLRSQHLEWPEERINAEVRRIFLRLFLKRSGLASPAGGVSASHFYLPPVETIAVGRTRVHLIPLS